MIGVNLIARRRTVKMFDNLGRSEWEPAVASMAADVHHVFPGEHPLGGERHSCDAVRRWFERLGRLYPGHGFAVQRVNASGPPWDLWIAVQWTAHLRPQVGEPYDNHGAHWIRVRRGRVVYFHAYLDTQRITEACREMAASGIAEAAAPPLVD